MKAHDLAHAAGITYRQLDYWSRVGYLTERSPGAGSGSLRDYTDTETAVAVRMGALVRAGVEPVDAHWVARVMVERHLDELEATFCDAPELTITYRYRPPHPPQGETA